MTVQNLLEKMNERAFGPAFQEYLFDTYKAMAQADFPEEEKGYTAAKDYFITTLQHAEIEILSQIEANFKVKLQYAAQYAFHAGLYSNIPVLCRAVASHIIPHRTADKESLIASCIEH